jgi:hypothetical protein
MGQTMQIRKAERKKAKLRLGISGASGSGKTWSALEIATGMGGKIGMIDTESGRGELYGNDFQYDIIRLEAPYSPDRYIEAIKTFEKSGYDIVIIDSLSHAWTGEGGVLSIVEKNGGQFQNGWKVGTPKQNALVDALINSKMHILITLRVKSEYVVEKNEKGKNEPRKIGLSPVQRDGLEYEFTVFMDIDNQQHIAHITKDNTKLFDQQYIKPSKEMGIQLMEWLNNGVDMRERFVNVLLPWAIIQLNNCQSLAELKEQFSTFYNQYNLEFPSEMEVFIAAKDKKKEELSK